MAIIGGIPHFQTYPSAVFHQGHTEPPSTILGPREAHPEAPQGRAFGVAPGTALGAPWGQDLELSSGAWGINRF
jgi:hypothetical protein